MYYKCVQTVQTLYLCDVMYVVSMIHTYSDKYNIWSHGTDSLSGMIRAATSSSMLMCWWAKISHHYVVKHFCGLNSQRTGGMGIRRGYQDTVKWRDMEGSVV